MKVLVCGGAGYIGSHMCRLLAGNGHEVGVVDNFLTGHHQAVRWGELFEGDIADRRFVATLLSRWQPDAIIHFAARSLVGESQADPALYYGNNVLGTLHLLEEVRQYGPIPFIFSSTAAIFGNPLRDLIDENHPSTPINAYGRTKLAIEMALGDYGSAYGLPSVCFRYFNAAGASPGAGIGEAHQPETHLIPRILEAELGRCEPLRIFGEDYDTPDGSCIRDFIHVDDLCLAHLAGIDYLHRQPGSYHFNLGNGAGFSVREVITATERVVGKPIQFQLAPRRPGDPARLVADSSLARRELGWRPERPDLQDIIATAWEWHRNRGY